jgi:2-desacetyl-2-hydroxyethyl bacteriochlorophyllide A dehydrogenase
MGHELAVEVVDANGHAEVRSGETYVVNPYLACGRCIACRRGKPNCCVRISVLGVHQDGGMAGLLAIPAGNLVPAEGLSADACATVEFLAIGAHAVRRGAPAGDEAVLVVGAGPIGLGVALFAREAGAARVVVMECEPERARAAADVAGVETLLAGDDAVETVRQATAGDGFDVVFDATGNRRAMEQAFDFVAHGGRYVLVGVMKEAITFQDPDFHRKEMTLFASRNATAADFDRVIATIRGGKVPVEKLITHRSSLAGAVRDLPVWATRKTGLIKALIDID